MRKRIYPAYLSIIPVLVFILLSFKNINKSQLPFNPSYSLWYNKAAVTWEEALPVGNGRMGAMIFGRPVHEKLQLNDITIWSGKPEPEADRPEAYKGLPEIRKAISDGNYQEAQRLTALYMTTNEKPGVNIYNTKYFASYQTLGDLNIDFDIDSAKISDYRRWLNIDEAIAGVAFKTDDNTFTREIFSSAPDGVIVVKLTSGKKGSLSFKAKLTRQVSAKTQFEAPNTLVMKGNTDYLGHKGNCEYEARLSVLTKKGSISGDGDIIEVKNADEATILITCGTSYIPDFDKNFRIAVPHDSIVKIIQSASAKSFEKLRNDHVTDYQKYFHRTSFDLGQTEAVKSTTEERLSQFNKGVDDPGLISLFYQYGRYLMISSSRPGNPLPSNSQGIWGDGLKLPWNCDYKANINYEMNYWMTEPSNLSDCHLPMLKYTSVLVKPGTKTAQAYFNAPGWVLAMMTNAWGWTSPGEAVGWGSFFGAGGWVSRHLWEHYAFTQDKDYLKWAYPVMKGSCEFYLGAMVEDKNGYLVTSPSTSPENSWGRGLNVDEGSTIELQIINDLFTNTIAACKTLNIDNDFRAKLETARAKIRPMKIGKAGQLQEWSRDLDMEAPELKHRHISHLFGLFPGNQISPLSTPDLAKAAMKTLEVRGDTSTGWSLAWKINFWARLMDGNHAYNLMKIQLRLVTTEGTNYSRGGGTYPNLFDAHPPFQIDGNFGFVSGVDEMLFQSQETFTDPRYPDEELYIIHLLPALPDKWPSGSIKGVRARGGFELDIVWNEGKLSSAIVRNVNGKECKIRYGNKTVELFIDKGKSVTLNSELVAVK